MTNEPLGIYEELRALHEPLEDREHRRKRLLSMVPAYNGAYAQQQNPFERPPVEPFVRANDGIPHKLKHDGYHKRNPNQRRRRREVYREAKLNITIAQVVLAVCIESGLSHGDLFSPWRTRRVAYPRHTCMYMIDRYCPEYSLAEIAYLFQRDHTSVMHGIQKTERRLENKHSDTRLLVANVHQRLAAIAEGSS